MNFARPSRHLRCVFDLAGKIREAAEIEERSAAPDFWDDPRAAQLAMQRLSVLRAEIERWQSVQRRIQDALELAEMGDESLLDDLTTEGDALKLLVDDLSFKARMSGKYDTENAILSLHAGAGGTESQDWVSMLLRMFLRWAESKGFQTEIIDQMEGEEAGIKSVTVIMRGEYAYGYLQSERGVHRLVRISPYDAAKRRHTSFALCEVYPDVQANVDIEIPDKDISIDTFRSSGAGGQNVQKNETAIRITHHPTGLIVTCQNERSRMQNLEVAMSVLRARLLEMELRKQEEEIARLKGAHVEMGWGNQIRSYVLHPYQMVKDHRTEYETGNASAVLDGGLDDFMQAYLKSRVGLTAP
jgi:peptide chain release factor 2